MEARPIADRHRISARERQAILGLVLRSYRIGRRALDNWRYVDTSNERHLLEVTCQGVQKWAPTDCTDGFFLWIVDRALARVLICLDNQHLSWDLALLEQADDDYELISLAMDALQVVAKRRLKGA